MRVRIRGPNGQATITLAETATVGDLRSQIAEKTSISNFDIKHGYPPKPLILNDHQDSESLSETGLKLDGEQLIVSESTEPTSGHAPAAAQKSKSQETSSNASLSNGSNPQSSDVSSSFSFAGVGTAPPAPARQSNKPLSLTRKKTDPLDAPELPMPSHSSTMVLRIMEDDNSCLFRAFGSAFFGGDMDNMYELRSIIAQSIQEDPETYSAAVLERDPDDYCNWIQTPDAWGGGIELGILSKRFDIEICSIDVQSLKVYPFNEGRPIRCILVYSGVHYDTIALSPSDAPHKHAYALPEHDTKIFDAADPLVLEKAVELCRVLQKKHYYTDTAGFTVRCNVCRKSFVGEKGATEHAAKTGHYDFGEAG
jgi:ubiquitin thioesterase OTU1